MTQYELVPENEAAQIEEIAELTRKQLAVRYPAPDKVLRGVHPKDHGCVEAKFTVDDGIQEALRVGLFASPGAEYKALVRFSNAATLVKPDSTVDPTTGKPAHGSRGMAVKLFNVDPNDAAQEQDFLMVNHPVFAFANVEDYLVLSQVILRTFDPVTRTEDPGPFFAQQIAKGGAAAARASETMKIAGRIRASSKAEGAFQDPPSNPVQNEYFSASPFLFGDGCVMKFRASPIDEPVEEPTSVDDESYLRTGLRDRLDPTKEGNRPVVFRISLQVRNISSVDVEREIENATTLWDEQTHPFEEVATLTIPPQDFETEFARARCEDSFFTPWKTLDCFRPLGGINRLRRASYDASMKTRLGKLPTSSD